MNEPCGCHNGLRLLWNCGYQSGFLCQLCPVHGGCLQGLKVVKCGCDKTPEFIPDEYFCRKCREYSRFDYLVDGKQCKKCHACGHCFDPEKEWLGNLGEDREWFIGWTCFGNEPSDPASLERYRRCWSKLSPRQQEECYVVSRGNTIDVISGTPAATEYIKNGMERIRRRYEEESDTPIVVVKEL